MNGWIKLHSKFLEWEWSNDPNMVALFIYLLLNANFKDTVWKGVQLKRGQLIFGRQKASLETGISVRTIRTCLMRLKSTNELSVKTTNKYSIITICKYSSYQSKIKDSDQQNDQQAVNPTTTDEEYKEERKRIIDHLNSISGKNFLFNAEKTKKHINARLREGYSEDDLKRVVNIKSSQWMDRDMDKFLRPETLFGTKLESYLNERSQPKRGLVR